MTRRRPGFGLVMAMLIALLAGVAAAALCLGVTGLSPAAVLRALAGAGPAQDTTIVVQLRLPRLLVAVAAGAALAISGAILQGVVRNVLAEPGLLGINGGAGLAAALFVAGASVPGRALSPGTSWFVLAGLPLAAWLGAGVAALLVYLLARRGGVTPWRLILTGIAVGHGLAAITVVVLTRLTEGQVAYAKVWLTGSIWAAGWNHAALVWVMLLLLGAVALTRVRVLDVLHLGDAAATGLGARVQPERRRLLALAAGLAGAAVAVAGTIGFLGLVAPHIARRLVGVRHARLLPAAACIGAALLGAADVIGHNLLAPREIPAGVVVAVLGGPYFCWLLITTRH